MKVTKSCASCGKDFESDVEAFRKCCSKACGYASMRGRPTWNKGLTFPQGKPMARIDPLTLDRKRIPCCFCKAPTKYPVPRPGVKHRKVRCENPKCVAAMNLQRIKHDRKTVKRMWSKNERTPEEVAMKSWFVAHGWQTQCAAKTVAAKRYILDFANPKRKLYVELDGPTHDAPRSKVSDAARDQHLAIVGWKGLRIPAQLVSDNIERVKALIRHFIATA